MASHWICWSVGCAFLIGLEPTDYELRWPSALCVFFSFQLLSNDIATTPLLLLDLIWRNISFIRIIFDILLCSGTSFFFRGEDEKEQCFRFVPGTTNGRQFDWPNGRQSYYGSVPVDDIYREERETSSFHSHISIYTVERERERETGWMEVIWVWRGRTTQKRG